MVNSPITSIHEKLPWNSERLIEFARHLNLNGLFNEIQKLEQQDDPEVLFNESLIAINILKMRTPVLDNEGEDVTTAAGVTATSFYTYRDPGKPMKLIREDRNKGGSSHGVFEIPTLDNSILINIKFEYIPYDLRSNRDGEAITIIRETLNGNSKKGETIRVSRVLEKSPKGGFIYEVRKGTYTAQKKKQYA